MRMTSNGKTRTQDIPDNGKERDNIQSGQQKQRVETNSTVPEMQGNIWKRQTLLLSLAHKAHF